MQLERCKSHEKASNPQAWEAEFTGTPTEIIERYEGYSYTCRVSDGFRVVDGDTVIDMQEFLIQHTA